MKRRKILGFSNSKKKNLYRYLLLENGFSKKDLDIGSKILPNNFSDLKLFIDAPIKIRALRRFKELKCKFPNKKILFKNILEDIKARDKVDSKRKISPLVKVKSAHLISNHTKYISTPTMQIIKLIKKVS